MKLKNLKNFLIIKMKNQFKIPQITCFETENVMNAINKLNKSGLQILLVIDKKNRYVGTITDGDIRRGFLKGMNINSKISLIVNRNSIFASNLSDKNKLEKICQDNKLRFLPLVNKNNKILDLYFYSNQNKIETIENNFVIMAGGKGKRLRPMTDKLPKALIPVLNKPLIVHIIEKAKVEGFRNFVITVNYLKNKIKEYLGNGSDLGVNISYIDEKKYLGTAGSLSNLKIKNKKPFIVSNCDVLTSINYKDILKFHSSKKNVFVTVAAKNYSFDIPFGVLKTKRNNLQNITEKPSFSYLINAGIYALDPQILNYFSKGINIDMTTLLNKISKTKKIIIYPIQEKWFDVANYEDIKNVNINFNE